MADMFRRQLDRHTGVGGVRCYCCNCYHGKSKSLLNRLARRTVNRIEDYEKDDNNENGILSNRSQNR